MLRRCFARLPLRKPLPPASPLLKMPLAVSPDNVAAKDGNGAEECTDKERQLRKRIKNMIASLLTGKEGGASDNGACNEAKGAIDVNVRERAPCIDELLAFNKEWATAVQVFDPNYFATLAKQQRPNYFWIGCSDSRVPANQIVGLAPGELFVHRNIANVVARGDLSMMACLQYAVQSLRIEDVIVCGHYSCGGVNAGYKEAEREFEEENIYAKLFDAQKRSSSAFAVVQGNLMQSVLSESSRPATYGCGHAVVPATPAGGLVDAWVMHIADVKRRFDHLLQEIPREYHLDALCEINVIQQTRNVAESTVTQAWWHCYRQQGFREELERIRAGDFDGAGSEDSGKPAQDDITKFHPLTIHGWIYDVKDGHIRPLLQLNAHDNIRRVIDTALLSVVARYKAKAENKMLEKQSRKEE